MRDSHSIITTLRAWRAGAGALLCAAALCGAADAHAEETTAIAAVPQQAGVSSKLSARLLSLLPQELGKQRFSLLDPRMVDVKLADRPDLLGGCDQEGCLGAQAQLLGVPRLLLPRLAAMGGRRGTLYLELTLYQVQGTTLTKLAEAGDTCEPCSVEVLPETVKRAAAKLRAALSVPLAVTTAPTGGLVRVDGAEAGRAPVDLTLEPGEHTISAESDKGRAERRLTLRRGAAQTLHLVTDPLLLTEPAPTVAKVEPRSRSMAIAKWTLLGAGLAAAAAGAAMLAVDGRGTCALTGAQVECPEILATRKGGIAFLAVGGVAVASSAVLFGLDLRAARGEQGEKTALLTMGGKF